MLRPETIKLLELNGKLAVASQHFTPSVPAEQVDLSKLEYKIPQRIKTKNQRKDS